MGKVRGVRFTAEEEIQIEEFLKLNSVLDFTTLAKIAILTFLKSPKFELKAVTQVPSKEKLSVRTHS